MDMEMDSIKSRLGHLSNRRPRYGNVKLTVGAAGTGKSTNLSQSYAKMVESDGQDHIYLLSPTGTSAHNIRGMTIRHFLGITPYSDITTPDAFFPSAAAYKRIRSAVAIYIDEVFAVPVSILRAMESAFCRIRYNSSPFGGVHVEMYGDYRQLRPVMNRSPVDFIINNIAPCVEILAT